MRFPLSWLKEWIELPDDLNQVKELLFKVGIELEAVESLGPSYENVVVAQVLERNPHPNADRLSLCKVTDGSQTYSIVCGAQNFQAGAVVPMAKEGAVLPGNFKIKKSKIRGVESEGMLCSAKELGLAEDAEGLMLLDASMPLGKPLAQALGLGDIIFTIQTTANRADHNSILGLARELSALTGKPFHWPSTPLKENGLKENFEIELNDPEACPFYSARILRQVKVGPSPAWLVKRLEGCGARSVNNIVDITNYILFELGQPLHAFDLAKLSGQKIMARRALAGETLTTLDKQELSLTPQDLVIADADKALALAGIMGGLDSGVTSQTQSILLEAAVFHPATIRRSSKRLNIHSESSYRFERGVDPATTLKALDHAASMIAELAGGDCSQGVFQAGSSRAALKPVPFSPERINQLLGTQLKAEEMASLLTRRYFEVKQQGQQWQAWAPSFRQEVSREADLAEEVVQMAGFQTVPSTPLRAVSTPPPDAPDWRNAWLLKRLCTQLGLQEAFTLSYLDPRLAQAWGMDTESLRLDNPISEEQSLLRPSLLPNLVASVAYNLNHQASGLALFEWGRVFNKAGTEEDRLAWVLAGRESEKSWNGGGLDYDFFNLKSLAQSLGTGLDQRLRLQKTSVTPAWLHPGQSAEIKIGPLRGWLGALHPALLEKLGLKAKVFVLELANFPAEGLHKETRYRSFSRLPGISRDLSCLLPVEMEAGVLLDFLSKDPALTQAKVRVIDLYQSDKLPTGKKSLAFSIDFLAQERTRTDAEVNSLFEAMTQRLEKALPVTVRRQ